MDPKDEKSVDVDGIRSETLELISYITKALNHLINIFIETGTFPDCSEKIYSYSDV